MPVRLAVLAALAALVLPSAAAHADNPVLIANVGANDNFSISLSDANGNPVTHLDPGTYTLQVHDKSEIHNFHLTGPGVDQKTDVATISDQTWTVTFTDGRYRFQCDPHFSSMFGKFTVGSPPPLPVSLRGTVGPGRTIALRTAGGAKVRTVATDTVNLTVTDRSKSDNFHLTGNGVNKSTGVGFRGRVTWKLKVSPGRYVYRSDRHKSLRGTFTVSASA